MEKNVSDVTKHDFRGLLTAIAGFTVLSIGDAVIKSIAGEWTGPATAALRFLLGAAGLAVLLAWREGRAGFRTPVPGLQAARGFALALATLFFFLSIFVMPLAEATAIQFTNPMITALLSAIFLGERIGWRAIVATVIAFTGVIVVLRPNLASLGIVAVLPVVAAFGMATLMILNRKVMGTGTILQAQFFAAVWGAFALTIAAICLHFTGVAEFAITVPGWTVVARLAVIAVTATVAHMLIYRATMQSSAALVAPAVYVQMIVAIVLGWAIFGNMPDVMTLFGAAMIIGSGYFLLRSSKR